MADEDVLLLPIPVIYETGNHIAQNGDGTMRRKAAQRFVQQVRMAFGGDAPWVPTPLQGHDELLSWLDQFPDSAMTGMGFSDLAITRIFEQQCAKNEARRVRIWSYDQHLQGYDRPARL